MRLQPPFYFDTRIVIKLKKRLRFENVKFAKSEITKNNLPKFKMIRDYSVFVCHFHKCDTLLWMNVQKVLERLCLNRVRAGVQSFEFTLQDCEFDAIQEFNEQMDICYLHPRRDAFQVSLLAAKYSNFTAKCHIEKSRKAAPSLPIRRQKKNLSQTR